MRARERRSLLKGIASYLTDQHFHVKLLAPTGRAARILQQKTGFEATTIHKGIYNLSELDEVETHAGGKKKYKFRYNLAHAGGNIDTIYIIDEASMISDQYSEDDFFIFGSGHLLKDLMDFIALNNQGRNNKLILVGDNAQLPPVTDNASRALDSHYLESKYGVAAREYELTEVVRQGQESGILSVATYLRDQLANSSRNSFQINGSFPDVLHITPSDVVNIYKERNPHLSSSDCIIINYSNKSALDFNLKAREHFFPGNKSICPGDILMINQNNYNYDPVLLNGMFVKVLEVSPTPEVRSGMKSYDQNGEDCLVTHKFRRIVIEAPTDDNRLVPLECFILENLLYSPNPSLDYAENIALYIDFKMRHPNLSPKTKEFKDALRNDLYFNALRVKFGYAVTCHKAQGGEWDNAIVNLDVSQGKLSDFFLRWSYTAVTRASRQLFLFNVPNENQFSRLAYQRMFFDAPAAQTGAEKTVSRFRLPDDYEERLRRFQLDDKPPFMKDKFSEILARLDGSGIEVAERISHQWQEVYVFRKAEQSAGLSFWYNGKSHFTRITNSANQTTDEGLFLELKALMEKPFVFHIVGEDIVPPKTPSNDMEAEAIVFPEEKKQLEILYQKLAPLLNAKGIRISSILHMDYLERYFFEKGAQKASINFWYDGKSWFTTAAPHLKECNSNELLNDLEECIHELNNQ